MASVRAHQANLRAAGRAHGTHASQRGRGSGHGLVPMTRIAVSRIGEGGQDRSTERGQLSVNDS